MKKIVVLAVLAVLFTACDKLDNDLKVKKEVFGGYVQKGPFVIGTSVTISELTASLDQTGRTYSTTISDNSGSFEMKNVELVSNYVALKADGYYFNEVSGQTSTGQMTLYTLVDVSNVNSANVNVLTYLEKPRVEYLIQQEGMNFSAAKKQARNELLAVLKVTLPDDIAVEALTITDDALLLFVSALVQGHLSTGDMSELLANISSDIRTDGTLDNPALGAQLMNNAAYIDWEQVIANMKTKYDGLGINVNVTADELKTYAEQFKQNSGFEQTLGFTYPATGKGGPNILADGVVKVKRTEWGLFEYSVKAELPAGNSSLKIVLKTDVSFTCSACGFGFPEEIEKCPSCGGNERRPADHNIIAWGGYYPSSVENWIISQFDSNLRGNTFTIYESGKPADVTVIFSYDCIVEYYENGATTPSKVKKLYVEPYFP